MATLYFKSSGGNFNGANWSTVNSAGGDSNTPTAADDCIVEAGSGSMTINSGSVCRSLDFTSGTGNYAGTVTHTAAVALSIGDATAGAGNVALKLSAGMTYTLGSGTTSSITLASTSTTQQTITTNGKTLGNIVQSATGSNYQFADALTSTGIYTQNFGTLDTNTKTVSWAGYTSTTNNTRVITITNSTITCTAVSGASWNLTGTGHTLNATGSTINIKTNMTCTAGQTYGTVVWDLQGVAASFSFAPNSCTFATLTINSGAAKINGVKFSTGCTVTGTLNFTGNSATNRVEIVSTAAGTARTFTCTGATVNITYADFGDIAIAGSPTINYTGDVGDEGGNSGFTVATPATQTHTTSAGGNWSDITKWTSRVPLPQDNVIVDANTTGTLTCDMPRMGKDIDLSNFAGTLAQSLAHFIYGSWTNTSGLTRSGTGAVTYAGRGTHTITTANVNSPQQIQISCTGSYTLMSDFTTTSGSASQVAFGTFDANDFNFTSPTFSLTGTSTRTVLMGNGTWTATSTTASTVWTALTTTGMTFNAEGSTIVISGASGLTKTFAGGGLTYNNLTYTVANSTATLLFSGNNTFANWTIGAGRTIQSTAGSIQTVLTHTMAGQNNGYLEFSGSSGCFVSTPDSAALSITGDIDIRVDCALDDWTPSSVGNLVSKYGNTNATRDYRIAMISTGVIRFQWYSGVTLFTKDSTVAPTVSDGGRLQVRMTHDVDNGATQNEVKFWTRASGTDLTVNTGWTQLGTTVTTAGTTAHVDSATEVRIGSDADSTQGPARGKFYQVVIMSGISGTVALDADFTTKAFGADTFTEDSVNAATMTLTLDSARAADGRLAFNSSSAGTQYRLRSQVAWNVGTHSVDKGNNVGPSYTAGSEMDYLTIQDAIVSQTQWGNLPILGVG